MNAKNVIKSKFGGKKIVTKNTTKYTDERGNILCGEHFFGLKWGGYVGKKRDSAENFWANSFSIQFCPRIDEARGGGWMDAFDYE